MLLFAVAGVAHREEVMATFTTSPAFKEVEVKVLLLVPTGVLFTNH